MQLPPIAATTIGSFPRPNWLAQPDRARVIFRLEGERLKEAQDDATALSIHTQERIGLDLLSDGEQRRTGFINHILAGFDGIDLEHEAVKTIYRRREQPRPVPRVVGKIKRRAPAIIEDLRFAKSETSKPIKMDLPGPMTVVDSTVDEFYKDEAAMAMDVAAALNEELRDLQAAGCDVIELDEPAMTRYHEKASAYGAKALDRCLEGITVPTVVHLCYGYPGGAGHQQGTGRNGESGNRAGRRAVRRQSNALCRLRKRHGDRHRDGADLAEAVELPARRGLGGCKKGGRRTEERRLYVDGRVRAGRLAAGDASGVGDDDEECACAKLYGADSHERCGDWLYE